MSELWLGFGIGNRVAKIMSARMLRRALKEQELQQSSRAEESSDDEVEEESVTGKPALNLFSLLGSEASLLFPFQLLA